MQLAGVSKPIYPSLTPPGIVLDVESSNACLPRPGCTEGRLVFQKNVSDRIQFFPDQGVENALS